MLYTNFKTFVLTIRRQFTEVQSSLETYLRSVMGWTNEQGQTIEELAAKVDSNTELRDRVECLEAEVEALKDLLYNSK